MKSIIFKGIQKALFFTLTVTLIRYLMTEDVPFTAYAQSEWLSFLIKVFIVFVLFFAFDYFQYKEETKSEG